MLAYHIERFTPDTSGLSVVQLPDSTAPAHGHVIIKIHAASLNYRDLMLLRGHYNSNQPLPLIPLSDGAGEIVAVGDGVTRVKVGDRVMGIFTQAWISGGFQREYWATSTLGAPLPGMLAEYNMLHETGVVPIPDYLSYEEAATLPCAAVTAWNALMTPGDLRPGSTVLVQGTGGVSLFALQFAKMMGAQVIATSSSDAKLEKVRAMGVDETINYKTTPDWGDAVRKLSGGGVDHVVEVGGSGTLPQSLRAVRADGRISVIGLLAAGGAIDPMPILLNAVNVRGILVGSRDMFEAMLKAMSLHQTHPVVDKVFGFDEARAAFAHLESEAHLGKIVIKMGE